jgi:hypothetical protein
MKYRIVLNNIFTKKVTPMTTFFETKEQANQRLKERYTSELPHNLIYDLQSTEEAKNETKD